MTSTLSRSLIFILILVGLNSAFGQDNPKKAEDTAEKLVTIHAEDAHLPSVLAILADRSGYNIVTGPAVNVQ
ncbi:MAG: hypothetical protein K9N34_06035, partial [Candidatus Marinimicrobia bacterium]|nr:hypothetical protein [Candidatus Neomarinimicrobiota bacterium]